MGMPTPHYDELKARLELQSIQIKEILENQTDLRQALLGQLGDQHPGLLEQQRLNISAIEKITKVIEKHEVELVELKEFRNEIKRIVGGIAISIPIAFELIKGIGVILWDLIVHRSK